jgi:hypothetical protein
MQLIRFVRTSVSFVVLVLAGFVLGCSGGSGSQPVPDKETSKQIAESFKNAQRQRKAAQAEAVKGPSGARP